METRCKCLWSSAIWLHSFYRKCILMAGVMEGTNSRYSCAWCQPGPRTPIIFLCNHRYILAKPESQEQLQHQLSQLLSHSYTTSSFQERLWNNSFLQNDTSWPAEGKKTFLLTSVGHFCSRLVTGAGECCFAFSLVVCDGADLGFTGTEVGRVNDFGADFLYMDVGFFPVLKKAAPTKIFGLGFRLLKEMVIAFLDSAGFVLLAGAVVVVAAGLAVTMLG